jgi:hypothetical protein
MVTGAVRRQLLNHTKTVGDQGFLTLIANHSSINITHAPAVVGVAKEIFAEKLGSDVKLETKTFNAGPAAIEASSPERSTPPTSDRTRRSTPTRSAREKRYASSPAPLPVQSRWW